MRIVHVVPFHVPVIGGVEIFVHWLCEYLSKVYGYDIYVVTYNRTRKRLNVFSKYVEHNRYTIVRVPVVMAYKNISYSKHLIDVVNKLNPDIVHVHVWRHLHVVQIALSTKHVKKKSRLVLHMHDPFYHPSQIGFVATLYYDLFDICMGRHIIKLYDRVIVLTPIGKDIVWRKFKVQAIVIPPAIEDNLLDKLLRWRSRGMELEEKIIVTLGRISKEKKIEMFVEAIYELVQLMKRMNNEVKVRGIVMGAVDDNAYYLKLRNFVRKKNVDVEFKTDVDEEKKYETLSNSAIYVHTSPYEGFGLALIEAQAFGIPCIVTGFGGQLYAAPPGISSLYAEASPKYIAKSMLRLLLDHGLYKKLSFNAKRWAAQFRLSAIANEIRTVYEEVVRQ